MFTVVNLENTEKEKGKNPFYRKITTVIFGMFLK